jgi:hypothetical protein
MTKASVWTVAHGDAWANKREGAKRVSKVFPTKAAAQAAGRTTAMREKVEHIIQNRTGRSESATATATTRAAPRARPHGERSSTSRRAASWP